MVHRTEQAGAIKIKQKWEMVDALGREPGTR
jgi:hypothetical protein